MPKFLITVIVVAAALWTGFYFFGNKVPPINLLNIFLFLLFLYIAFGVTFSIPLYFLFQKKARVFTLQRKIYRRSLKWALFASFGIVGTLGLKAFDLINILNFGLFLVLYVVLFFQLRGRG